MPCLVTFLSYFWVVFIYNVCIGKLKIEIISLLLPDAAAAWAAAAADVSVIDVSDFEIVRGDVALGDVGIVSFILVDMAGSIFATADPLESLLSATKSNLKRMIINSEWDNLIMNYNDVVPWRSFCTFANHF